jgi:hypothetical protein
VFLRTGDGGGQEDRWIGEGEGRREEGGEKRGGRSEKVEGRRKEGIREKGEGRRVKGGLGIPSSLFCTKILIIQEKKRVLTVIYFQDFSG